MRRTELAPTNRFADSERRVKSNQILPGGPSVKGLTVVETRRSLESDEILTFSEAFGIVGVLMLCVLVVCIVWTAWLVFLALEPNRTANWLMNTEAYNNGEFWLIKDSYPHVTLIGAVGLVVVDVCYLDVALRMLLRRNMLLDSAFPRQTATWKPSKVLHCSQLRVLRSELTSFKGKVARNG